MSLEELEEQDLFLPESAQGELDLSASVSKTQAAGVFLLGFVGALLMILGAGEWLTWVGAVLFLAFLFLFTWTSNRGIDRQNEEVRKLQSKKGSE